MSEKVYYVYKIINCINNKIYIGKHKGLLNDNYLGSGKIIKRAIQKYGKENFNKEILIICKDNQEANYWEKYYIQEFNSFQPNGYNISKGGDWGDILTYNPNRLSIIQKIKNSSTRKGKSIKENYPNHSKAISKRNRDFCTGKTIEEMYGEEKALQMHKHYSKIRKGSGNSFYGKHHSAETIQKIKKANIRRIISLETRQKMSKGHKGQLSNKDPRVQEKQKLAKIRNIYENYLVNFKFNKLEEIINEIRNLKKNNVINKHSGVSFNKNLWEQIIGYNLDD